MMKTLYALLIVFLIALPLGASDLVTKFDFPPEYGSEVQARNPAIGFRADGSLIYAWRGDDWKLWIYDQGGKLIRIHDTGYHDIGEKGGVLCPFMFWDLTGDGVSELITRAGRAGTDSTWIQVVNPETGELLARIPFPAVYNWQFNQVHYLAVVYLDGPGSPPSIISQVGVHSDERFTAFDLQVKDGQIKRITQRWEILNTSPQTKGSGGHAIWVFDTNGDGRDELLFGAMTVNHDGTPLWFVGQEGRSDGYDGYTVGHVDYIGIGDIIPSEPGLEAGYCIEGGGATHKAPGVYVASLSDVKILWSDLTGHVDIGWVADISSENEGLEFGAWTKTGEGIGTFRLYTGTGQKLFEEDCPDYKYTKVLRWLGNGLAQVMICADGSHRSLAEWKNGSWSIREESFYNGRSLPRRYAKGDFWGDSRDELITSSGRVAWINTNPDPPVIQEEGIRDLTNYWSTIAIAGASYTYYPPYLYPRAGDPDPPWITLTSPRGRENWIPRQREAITWMSSSGIEYVRLDYSVDNGRNWMKIASRTLNDGSRDWIVPDVISDSCRVKITSKDSENIFDVSELFSIGPESIVTDTTIVMEKDGKQFRVTISIE